MNGHSLNRLPLGAVMVLGMLGCTIPAPSVISTGPIESEGVVRSANAVYKVANGGLIRGNVSANAEVMALAGASDFTGATISAYDTDGTRIAGPTDLTPEGTFSLSRFKESRPRVFLEVTLKNVYFRTVTKAPRLPNGDYEVTLDPGTTFLADKLRRSAIDHEVPFDRLDEDQIEFTEETILTYLNRKPSKPGEIDETAIQAEILTRGTLSSADGQSKLDLNANTFDFFAERHYPVKMAVYQLAKGIWRGWKPSPSPRPGTLPSMAAPTVAPSTNPSPVPSESINPG